MLGGSSSPQPINTAIFPFASPGRFDLANCVAGSTGAGAAPAPPRPAPPAAPRGGPPRPSPGDRPQLVESPPRAAASPGAPRGVAGTVSGRMLKFGDDIKTMPLTAAPFAP